MLPSPTFCLSIPSIEDDTQLECRVYHPPKFSNYDEAAGTLWQKKGAIVAHPYAPLGGSFDDPIVTVVVEQILRGGFIVGTFNFRGAGASKSRTSWSGRAELKDYVSFVGFFLHYLEALDPPTSVIAPSPTSPTGRVLSPVQPSLATPATSDTTLVLGGYSYGSLMTMSLPSVESILGIFESVSVGSAAAEIRLRAARLSKQWNTEVLQTRRRGCILNVEDTSLSPSAICGGEESEPGTRRTSRDSRKSIDAVRKSLDRTRMKMGQGRSYSSEDRSSSPGKDTLKNVQLPAPQVRFLLISPLLPPISTFLAFATRQWSYNKPQETSNSSDLRPIQSKLWTKPTLAIYGDRDLFTSHKRLRKWAKQLNEKAGSYFISSEITGVGHFWHEDGAADKMRNAIKEWLAVIGR